MSDYVFVIKGSTIISEKPVTWNVEAREWNASSRVDELNQMVSLFAEQNKNHLFLVKWREVSKMLKESPNGDLNCPSAENVISYSFELIPFTSFISSRWYERWLKKLFVS
jgi:hypothetical protein